MTQSSEAAVQGSDRVAERLTDALLDGEPVAALARDYGLAITQSYSVAALSISAKPADRAHRERALHRIRRELEERYPEALARLSPSGGTLLVPVRPADEGAGLDDVLACLSRVAQVEFTGVSVATSLAQIPAAVGHMHELLDVALALERTGRVHQPGDLALEWQLLRPSPAREYLVAIADSLEQRPDLLETLRLFAYAGLDRARVARMLHIHPNTVDYRLKRVAHLTGHDPTHTTGLWYLRSVLTVYVARSNSYASL